MVKKLRYYARFIVVCLLLKKMKLVRDLVRELSKHIDDYTATYEPEDQLEWTLVLGEIKSFIEADTVVNVLDSDSNSIVLSHRLNPLITPPVEKSPIMTLSLQGCTTQFGLLSFVIFFLISDIREFCAKSNSFNEAGQNAAVKFV